MNDKNNVKISLVGPYPLPYGGVSVHIQRLKDQLEENGFRCVVYDLDAKNVSLNDSVVKIKFPLLWILKYSIFAKEDIIHFHYSDWRARILFGLMTLLGKKIVITIHGESMNESIKNSGYLKKKLITYSLKHTSYIIAVNPKIKECALSLGVDPEFIDVIPAFIPPVIQEKEIKEIPQEIWEFIEQHTPIISANAYKITFFKGQDLYGIDMCIDLCANLKQNYPNIGFVFCLPTIGDNNYYEILKNRIISKGIENNFLFITEKYNFYPILMKSQIFVRPTNTDGDSVSIREALHFDIPVVTSDVINRPTGAIIFINRDIDDLTEKILNTLEQLNDFKSHIIQSQSEDNSAKIIEIYQFISGEKR
ncbi:glycosyltransferase family 4 protein [Methanogenium sp. S4BF]|uniref:glycosyltransferase family 4 protein n=1 Tax=Methanogenium sp. S4BF TaxID=1789226 RepID=UPI00241767F5|nr:glycosyltransferase family 4 protein [Methanogenium sp. S4BF]WFN35013.1 glycosyltransferase family 4 protein [Methanogenium sp. S4BF]